MKKRCMVKFSAILLPLVLVGCFSWLTRSVPEYDQKTFENIEALERYHIGLLEKPEPVDDAAAEKEKAKALFVEVIAYEASKKKSDKSRDRETIRNLIEHYEECTEDIDNLQNLNERGREELVKAAKQHYESSRNYENSKKEE